MKLFHFKSPKEPPKLSVSKGQHGGSVLSIVAKSVQCNFVQSIYSSYACKCYITVSQGCRLCKNRKVQGHMTLSENVSCFNLSSLLLFVRAYTEKLNCSFRIVGCGFI